MRVRLELGEGWRQDPSLVRALMRSTDRLPALWGHFSLQVEGVPLHPGRPDERLDVLLPAWLGALERLRREPLRAVTLMLEASREQLVVVRKGGHLRLQRVPALPGAEAPAPAVELELAATLESSLHATRRFVLGLRQLHPPLGELQPLPHLMRLVEQLESGAVQDDQEASEPWQHAPRSLEDGRRWPGLLDSDGLASRGSEGPGVLLLPDAEGRGAPLWQLLGRLDAARTAWLGGTGPRAGSEAARLLESDVALGLELVPLLRARASSGSQPWLDLLEGAARELERALGAQSRPEQLGEGGLTAESRPQVSPPLPGKVRRVGFEQEARISLPFLVDSVQPFGAAWLASGPEGSAWIKGRTPKLAWAVRSRVVATRGALLAQDPRGRWLRLDPSRGDASWMRATDEGEPVRLERAGSGADAPWLVTERRGIRVVEAASGAPRWAWVPTLVQRLWTHLSGGLVYVATSQGQLSAHEVGDGRLRFRLAADVALRGAPVRAGKALFQVVEGPDQDHLVQLDAATGKSTRSVPLGHRQSGQLLASRGRVRVIGRTGEGWVLASLMVRTGVLTRWWVDPGMDAPALIATPDGGDVALLGDGSLWRAPWGADPGWKSAGESPRIAGPLPLRIARGLVLAVGERARLAEIASGRTVGTFADVEGVTAAGMDASLRVALVDDGGTLHLFRHRGHLASL